MWKIKGVALIVKWSLFCEDVQTVNGKGNLIGVMEDWVSPFVPYGIGQMAVVLGIDLTHSIDAGFVFVIRFTSTRETVFHSSEPAWNHLTVYGNGKVFKIVPFFIHNITLPQFGKYTFEVLVDGQKVHANSFRLLQLGR